MRLDVRARDVKTRLFTLIVIITNVLGDSALKWGMQHQAEGLSLSPLLYIKAIFSPFVFLGVSLLLLWMLSRMTLLSWADLSYVLPVTSIGYVLITFIGRFFFNEAVTPARWIGTLCIIGGMVLVGTTSPRTTPARPETSA